MSRIRYIDSIKGFAVICVVIGHIANGYLGEAAADGLYGWMFNAVYAFHMPLFFAVSGFLFAGAYLPDGQIRKDRIKAQVIRLVCLYMLFSLLLGGLKILFSGYVNNQITASDLLRIPIKPIEIYWYLFVLIIYYLIFSREWIIRLNGAAVFLITLIIGAASNRVPWGLYFEAKRLLYHLPYFYLGILLNKNQKWLEKKSLVFALLPCVLLLYVLFWNHGTALNQIPFVNQALGLACSLCVFGAFRQYQMLGENKCFLFVGKYSLEIYLLHTFVLTAFRALLHILNIENPAAVTLISLAAGVLLPVLIAYTCKKLRIYNFIFNPYKSRKRAQKNGEP